MPQPKKYASHAQRQRAYRIRCNQVRQLELVAKGLPCLPAISSIPGLQRWKASLEAASLLIACTANEMQDYYDERSEIWQESERGINHDARREELEALLETLGELI